MEANFKFRPIYSNWVAIHPHPIGVVNFIGGAFFGSFPTVFYRYLLQHLFEAGYTIIAIPFRFTFRHWNVSIGLVSELQPTLKGIRDEAKALGYEYAIYDENPCAQKANFFWLGHSLGSKYIALLEYLTDVEDQKLQEDLLNCNTDDPKRAQRELEEISTALRRVDRDSISLRNQPSLLMAPEISDTVSAVRIEAIATLIDNLGLGVTPTKGETFCLIQRSQLFNLMALIAFEGDDLAQETVECLRTSKLKCSNSETFPCGELSGSHLQPLGFRSGDTTLASKVLDYLQKLASIV